MARKTTLLTLILAFVSTFGFAQHGQACEIPVSFSNNLISATLAANGYQLNLLANTAGGTFVTNQAMTDFAIPEMIDEAGNQFVELDPFLAGSNLPVTGRKEALILPVGQGNLPENVQGALGQKWFSSYCWTLDYLAKELHCNTPPLSPLGANTVPVRFRESAAGHRISNLPVITIEVDGVEVSVLLDTGAKVLPTEAAFRALDENNAGYTAARETMPAIRPGEETYQAISFITESFFDAWRSYHPEWPVVEQADREMGNIKMIKVPEVTIAGHTVGPVWFCSRPDVEYTQYWSRFSGQQVEGAIGGNVLQYFRLTLDYPNKLAKFDR
ncbi:MAG: hypothetical protein H6558_01900 [Lewinellaceae bacterium]|nr:hypothetical protein [Lewinellaceae bacterium]MCB9286831.1 hypothetical protein [Lewinellaceae bacterium]